MGSVLLVVYEEGASGFPCLCGLPGAPSCVWGLFFVVGVVGDGVDVVVGLVG